MSRIYQSVTSYLPFGRKADASVSPTSEPGKPPISEEAVAPPPEAPKEENGNVTEPKEASSAPEEPAKEDEPELPSNKKTDEVYDPKAQPGLIRWAAGGLVGTASSAVGYGVGGIKWVANTGYTATSTVVSTTTGAIKKVPQVIKRKDKKE